MRRSGAPSLKKTGFAAINSPQKSETKEVNQLLEVTAINCVTDGPRGLLGNKIVFTIQWRPRTTKKHKTWKGYGTLEVQLEKNRAVLLDHAGKYMGSTAKFKVDELQEDFELHISDKEVQILQQIKNDDEYWTMRKGQMENRDWGSEEWQPPEKKLRKTTDFGVSSGLQLALRCENKTVCESTSPLELEIPNSASNKGNRKRVFKLSNNIDDNLRPHQDEGVKFMLDCLMGYRQSKCHGCILADAMGLGKTLQVLIVAHKMLRQTYHSGQSIVQRVLIVTPKSLMTNWNNEIHKWLRGERMYAFMVDGSSKNKHTLSASAMQPHIPFVIVSYETLLSQVEDFHKIRFDLLICDEGHRLKNPDTQIYRTMRGLAIKHRILVTGTPVQNELMEYFALADFVNPGIFGTCSEFRRYYETPINQGATANATEAMVLLATERGDELKRLSSNFMLQRSQDINVKYLPKKTEYICLLCPSKLQHLLMREAIKIYKNNTEIPPFEMIAVLRKICNHPSLLQRTEKANLLTRSLVRFVRTSDLNPIDSSKLVLVQSILQTAVLEQHNRVVLVSYHTKTLNVLQKLCDNMHIKFLRLDGTTSTSERNATIATFNSRNTASETDGCVLLLSAKAGGVGLNLIGGSRLVLYDIDWNPANDAQALSRIWREGQQDNVHIYRLITAGCIEEKIFQRQMAKTKLSECVIGKDRVVSDIDGVESMKFSTEELQELFYLQYDYNLCETHQGLNCDCKGDGQNLGISQEFQTNTKQIDELMHWMHFDKSFLNESVLEEACLLNAKDHLTYLFTSTTQHNFS